MPRVQRVPRPAPAPQPTLADMSAAGLRAFFNIANDWTLSADEQIVLLGSPGRSTFFKWKSAPETARLGRDTLERLSLTRVAIKEDGFVACSLAAR